MARALSLAGVLVALWLGLSGYFEPLLLVLGAVSCGAVLLIALRMDVLDHEWYPIHLLLTRLFTLYWPWLIVEIVKANIGVARCILNPKLPISPTVVRIKAGQRTRVGLVTYANSITLTPGTVAIDVNEEIAVHALTRAAAEGLRNGKMNRRVSALENVE